MRAQLSRGMHFTLVEIGEYLPDLQGIFMLIESVILVEKRKKYVGKLKTVEMIKRLLKCQGIIIIYTYISQMINQVTLNSNNATDMSRVELISWLNQLISFNVQRIQQLGSGVAYCYLMDLLYPGKIAIGKVNTKAKFEYEFICNFKILQQSFTKLGIMKNIEVQKLIKCKYQDNLEFLQWFKKIFDSNIISGKDYNSLIKKTDEEVIYKRKQQTQRNNHQNVSKDYLNLSDHLQRSFLRSKSFYNTERSDQNDSLRFPSSVVSSSHYKIKEVQNQKLLQSPYYDSEKQKLIKQESQLHLKKIMMIEGLMQVWDTARRSQQLIEEINIILKCKDLKFLEQYKEISGIIKSDCLMIDNQ